MEEALGSASLTNMTLNKVVLPAGESVYQDAKGQPMPPQRWPTEFHYVDGGLDQADTTDFVCVNRIIAEPWRQCFAVPPVDIPVGGRPRDAAGHAQVSRQAKHYAHKGINALMSCDKAFQNPCHSEMRERKYVQQHIRICTHGVKTGLG